jgi:hypothetical protein
MPEAPFSVSFKYNDADGYDMLITARGWSPDSLMKTVAELKTAISSGGGSAPSNRAAVQNVNPEPVRVDVGNNGDPLPEIKTTVAEGLEIDLFKDKLSVHVIGKPWTKYGIPMYEETWVAAGLDLAVGKEKPDITGWTVEYICKPDGKPQKVTRLLKAK